MICSLTAECLGAGPLPSETQRPCLVQVPTATSMYEMKFLTLHHCLLRSTASEEQPLWVNAPRPLSTLL